MRKFCCPFHCKQCMPGQILAWDQESASSQSFRQLHKTHKMTPTGVFCSWIVHKQSINIHRRAGRNLICPFRTNFPVSFWASDTLKQCQLGCQVEFSRLSTSLRYLCGMATVSLLILMIRPSIICLGPMTTSSNLSMTRGHCLATTSGSPITTKIALITVAKTVSMCALFTASISALSTYIHAGRSKQFFSLIMPWLIAQEKVGVISAYGSASSHFNMTRYFLCLMTRSSLFANTFIKALIACLYDSQLDADVVEPNTIAVARLYKSLAMKPKALVKSAWIFAKQKQDLMLGIQRRIMMIEKPIRVL